MLYSNIQMMRLKKMSKLVNVSRGYVYTQFARATTHARTMGPSLQTETGGRCNERNALW